MAEQSGRGAIVPLSRPLGELQAGVELTKRQNPTKASEIESWLDQLAASYQVLAIDVPCFREWGRIMDGKPDQLLEDAMIAATARVIT